MRTAEAWAEIARHQAGVISRRQLIGAGVSRGRVDRLLSTGALEPLARGMFRVRGAPTTYPAQLWRATLATRGALALQTAAHQWGVTELRPPVVQVTVDPRGHPWRPHDVEVHRLGYRADALTTLDGLPVVNRVDTILDVAGRLHRRQATTLIDRAVQRRWLDADDLRRRLAAMPNRTGNQRLREVLDLLAGNAAAESERVLHDLLRSAGIGGWTANLPVVADGARYVLDVGFPDVLLAIEVDGMAHHTDVERFQGDRTRQNHLVNAGWRVLRFTWADLIHRPAYVVATIRRELVAEHGPFAARDTATGP